MAICSLVGNYIELVQPISYDTIDSMECLLTKDNDIISNQKEKYTKKNII